MAIEDENLNQEPDIEIVLEAETGPEPAPIVETKVEKPSDGIDELRANLDAANKRAEEAERLRREAEERASRTELEIGATRAQTVEGRINQLDSALAEIKSRTVLLQRDHAAALQEGNYDKASDIQQEIIEASVHRAQLQQGRQQWEEYKRNPQRQAVAPQPQAVQRQAPRPTGDQVEDFVAGMDENSPNSKAWVRAHPEYVRDPELQIEMQDAHQSAVLRGYKADSPAYFAYVEKKLGIAKEAPATPEMQQRRVMTPAAPVSRSQSTLSTAPKGARQTVTLTPDECEMADAQGVPRETWARNKLLLLKQVAH